MRIVQSVLERFEQQAPITVMVRAALENVLSAERLDGLFQKHSQRQRNHELLFSAVCDLMGLVAMRIHPSPHAVFQTRAEELGVTVKAVYDKLQRMEPNLSRQLVRETAGRMAPIIHATGGARTELLPGYRVRILDGNHLRRTQRRIGALRKLNAAPLPAQALVVLDPQTRLMIDVFPCEDGHAQERSLLPEVLETVRPGEVWIDDRNFCTAGFLFGIRQRRAFFITRQHSQSPRYELVDQPVQVGLYETGTVWEQPVRIFQGKDHSAVIRRITVQLKQPTRDGDRQIHLLTNLPKKAATAVRIAELYRQRWTIETAFADVAKCLEGELETLGYPRAALFSFCSALVAFNLLSVVMAALRGVHGEEVIEQQVSFYYLADELAHTHRGLTIAVPSTYWTKTYAGLTPAALAKDLLRIARAIKLSKYRKHKRGPKKKTKKPPSKKGRNHVSTARVLAAAKT